jgi:D-glycero-D-manno-heptose 1,7-bisphosphate phosphatase
MNPAIFLDRDGTLIEDNNFPWKKEHFFVLPGISEGLNLLKEKYKFFIITNQSGIARGYFTENDFWNFNNLLIDYLEKNNIKIEKTYFCPHLSGCECKKPSTKFIDQIVEDYHVDVEKSWAIGDHPHDVEMGLRAGCRTIYLLTGHGKKHINELIESKKPNYIANDFLNAANIIKRS